MRIHSTAVNTHKVSDRASRQWSYGASRIALMAMAGMLAFAPLPAVAIVLNDVAAANLPGAGAPTEKVHEWYDAGNAYPNVVAVFDKTNGTLCTGTLLNHRTVLSAAHCFYNKTTQALYLALDREIKFAPDAVNASTSDRAVAGFAVNPLFGHALFAADPNDVALVAMKTPVTNVAPVRLLQPGEALPAPGTLVRIAGYGRYGVASGVPQTDLRRRVGDTTVGTTGPNILGDVLVQVEFRDPANPAAHNLYNQTAPVPEWQSAPESGDSGGPMFMVMPDGSLAQIGVMSAGGAGYGSSARYPEIPFNRGWIDASNPLRYITANPGTWAWSDPAAWTDGGNPAGTAPYNRDGAPYSQSHGDAGRYYEVFLSNASHVFVDNAPVIDRLVIANADAKLEIQTGQQLSVELQSLLQNGHVRVDGVLETGRFIDPDPNNKYAGFTQYNGRVSGTGVIIAHGGFVQKGGVLSPGYSGALGQLTIQGDYFQEAAGTLAVRVDEHAGSDRLVVTGQANLAGNLSVAVLTHAPARTQQFTVLQAGSLSGGFSAIDVNLPAFAWTTHVVGNSIVVVADHVDYTDDVEPTNPVHPGEPGKPGEPGNPAEPGQPEWLPIAPRYEVLNAHGSARALTIIANRIPLDEAYAAAEAVRIGDVPFPSTPALAVASLNTMDAETLSRALLALPPSGFHTQTGFGIVTSRLTSAAIFERLGSLGGSVAPGFSNLNALN
ncbi:trypsin-like serine protease, partial [Camelimonas fluminis]